MKLVTIAGTRPEIIKLAYLIPLLNNNFDHKFVYTGQHFSPNMSDIFIDELKVKPDYDLQSNSSDISKIRTNLLPVLERSLQTSTIKFPVVKILPLVFSYDRTVVQKLDGEKR